MDWIARARELIKRHEGLRLKPYRCPAGKLTIGYGRNLEDVGISEEEAEVLLQNDLRRAVETAARCAAEHGVLFETLPEDAKVVLTDMAFNLGFRLSGFRRMFAALKRGDYEEAAREMLDSLWARQVGERARELSGIMKNIGR